MDEFGHNTVWNYIDARRESLMSAGRKATAVNYGKAGYCLRRFCDDDRLSFDDITSDFVRRFNEYLENSGIKKTTISYYNRTLRSIYNQAVAEGMVVNSHPFDMVYTEVKPKLTIVSGIRSEDGEVLSIEGISKEELLRQYLSLLGKYNTLVHKLSAIVGA